MRPCRPTYAGRPRTVTSTQSTTGVSVNVSRPVHSGMIAASARGASSRAASAPLPVHSSSITDSNRTSPRSGVSVARTASQAQSAAASPPFMSHAPRPWSRPPSIRPENGSPPRPPADRLRAHDVDVPVQHERSAAAGPGAEAMTLGRAAYERVTGAQPGRPLMRSTGTSCSSGGSRRAQPAGDEQLAGRSEPSTLGSDQPRGMPRSSRRASMAASRPRSVPAISPQG